MASISERTFIAIKPDGVQRGLVGEIIKRFEQKGFKLVAMKLVHASEDLLREHYIDLKDRPFYDGLVQYMHSGPVVAMVWEGLNVVKTGRVMLGETNPFDSKPGTIRGDLCVQVGRYILKLLISSKDTKCPVVYHDICHDIRRSCSPSSSILCAELPFPVPV
ncbi:nucleoside diphosphate kinase isoform X3 [Egretta garzetta]|nr:nucleoside diphosphate kinase isoform X3 [Egretta garzetta]XP_035749218.1 nucleoside diphosphate kinase isoform X3 [Egretta garzetta]XP_035749219.1 nucleoside diphosphate kinase isoform X3 [Egretta garzetta]XP_035749220.1 nucleoside diphosphate kinase isoform X3 [Egretta garzetta]